MSKRHIPMIKTLEVFISDTDRVPVCVYPTSPTGSLAERIRTHSGSTFSVARPRRPIAPCGGSKRGARVVSWEKWLEAYLPVAPTAMHVLYHLRIAPNEKRQALWGRTIKALARQPPIPRAILGFLGAEALEADPARRKRFLELGGSIYQMFGGSDFNTNFGKYQRLLKSMASSSEITPQQTHMLADFATYVLLEREIFLKAAAMNRPGAPPTARPDINNFGFSEAGWTRLLDGVVRVRREIIPFHDPAPPAHSKGNPEKIEPKRRPQQTEKANPIQSSVGRTSKHVVAWSDDDDAGDLATPIPPSPFTGNESPFQVPEWDGIGMGELSPDVLARHMLITGETGSGKTLSAIEPLLRSVVRYGRDERSVNMPSPAVVLVDPKAELVERLERYMEAENLACDPLIKLEIGGDWRIDAFPDGAPHPDQIVGVLEAVSPPPTTSTRKSDFFDRNGRNLSVSIVRFEEALYAAAG